MANSRVGISSAHAAVATKVILFIVFFGNSVHGKPSGDSFGDILPQISSNFDLGKFEDVIEGKRDLSVTFSDNGLEVIAGMTIQEKIVIGAAAAGTLLVLVCCCICCCKCFCSRNGTGQTGSSSTTTTTIVYEHPPRNCHAVNTAPISSVAAAAGWTQDCPPPPYASIVSSPTSFKRY